MISIDCTLVDAEVARNMYESSELEWLVYHAPVDYVNLLLHGDIREHLRNTTDDHPFDDQIYELFFIPIFVSFCRKMKILVYNVMEGGLV